MTHALDNIPGGIYVCSTDHDFPPLFESRAFLQMLDLGSPEEFKEYTGHNFWNIVYPDDQERVKEIFSMISSGKKERENYDLRLLTKTGRIRLVRFITQRIRDIHGDEMLISFGMDFGLQSPAAAGKNLDPLTGMITMHAFFSEIDYFHEEAEQRRFAVLFLDIQNFREINMQFGFEAGDDFLRNVAHILRTSFSEYVCSRFDGDRFAILTDENGAEEKACRVREQIRLLRPEASIDCDFGACVWDDPELSAESVCEHAKIACDFSRESVGSFFSYYTPEMRKKLELADYVTSHFDEAAEKRWIRAYYQPIIRSISGKLAGMEALARWEDPERGMLAPISFIPPLESAQKVWKLDLCIIRQAVKLIADSEKNHSPIVPISVNLSRTDFYCCDIFQEVENIVKESGISRNMLHIEVTESVLTSREEVILQSLERFRKAGYEILMDDFGSGYSNLNLLKDYSYDILKLDMGFLKNVTPRSRPIISSIITLSKKVQMRSLAEGVETAEQYAFLKESGCDYLQGYYFGKPLPYEQSLQKCLDHGIRMESRAEKNYLDSLISVDFQTDLPMVLTEYENRKFTMLFRNDPARNMHYRFGLSSSRDVEDFINDRHNSAAREMAEAAEYAIRLHKDGEFYFPVRGQEFLCRYSLLADGDHSHLLEAIMFNYARNGEHYSEKSQMLMNLWIFYNHLYAINLDQMTCQGIRFMKRAVEDDVSVPLLDENGHLSSLLPDISPEDQRRYDFFMNPKTLRSDLAKSEKGLLAEPFRTKDTDGKYRWMTHLLIQVPNSEETLLLYAIRDMDADFSGIVPAPDETTGLINLPEFLGLVAGREEEYRKKGIPYCILIARISGLEAFRDAADQKTSEEAVKACAEVFIRQEGDYRAAARISYSRFALLVRGEKEAEVRKRAAMIRKEIASIHDVDGISCQFSAEIRIRFSREQFDLEHALIRALLSESIPPEEKRQKEIKESRKVLQSLLDSSPIGGFILAPDRTILYWNHAAEELLGYSAEEMIGRRCSEMPLNCSDPDGSPILTGSCPALHAYSTGKAEIREMFLTKRDGKDILIRNTVVPLQDRTDQICEVVSLFTPVTEEHYDRNMIREIYAIATRDPVTGLPGRKYMETVLNEELENFRKTGEKFAVLFADADNFHGINNTYGHETGDEILRAFGSALKHFRNDTRFCRWGGDEFVGLLKISQPEEQSAFARQLENMISTIRITVKDQDIALQVSAGITEVQMSDDIRSLIARADHYMYLAKNSPGVHTVTDCSRELIESDAA